ncbi:MAG: sigma-70 family RNA polymerase sigma factor [Myxococcales bacterium]|nr:sigma-70 family RNA polymerase sigma factor [Myxococcales bacterium]
MSDQAPPSDGDPAAEAALLDAARAGDRAALERLIEQHQARIYRFGLKMCRDPEVAKDVVQETLIAMARGVRDFRGGSSLSTWLYTIARSYCIKARRTSKFAPRDVGSLDAAPEAIGVADPGPRSDEQLGARRIEQALERAIAALDDKYREVLVLRDVEGLTAPEVAAVLGLSVDAVKSRLHRARLDVRARVAPALRDEAPPPSRSCPDVLGVFSRHLEGEVDAGACAEMERHLAGCPSCRGACDSLRGVLAMCRAAPADVPAPVQRSVQRAIRDLLATEA